MNEEFLKNMMQQVQIAQEKFKQMQQDVSKIEITGQSGAGLVTVQMNGAHNVKRVNIDDSLLTEEKSVLEDLIAAAINDAVRKLEKENQAKMANMASNLNLPNNLFDMFKA